MSVNAKTIISLIQMPINGIRNGILMGAWPGEGHFLKDCYRACYSSTSCIIIVA